MNLETQQYQTFARESPATGAWNLGLVSCRQRAHTWTRLHRRPSCEEYREQTRRDRDRKHPTAIPHATTVRVRVMDRVRRIIAGAGRGEGKT
jgi:hypothetical protein